MGIQVSVPQSKDEELGSAVRTLVLSMIPCSTTFNIGQYINIANFSSHSSDSEGTTSYKKLRRELYKREEIEVQKRQLAEK